VRLTLGPIAQLVRAEDS